MKKISLQVKVGLLMSIASILVIAAGILSHKSLSSIVSLIYGNSKPDYRLYTLKSISSDLEKAENSVRIYTITQDETLLRPYYNTISTLDDKINKLSADSKTDPELLSKIDTISHLIENKFVAWGQMLRIYNNGNIEIALKKLSDEISSKPDNENNLFKRFIKQHETENLNNAKIAQQIVDIEKINRNKKIQIKNKEIQLAKTNNEITSMLYSIIEQIENIELKKIKHKAIVANYMANRTYRLLTIFSIAVTMLTLLVLFIIARYVRKAHAYQKALEQSKAEAENLARAKELFMANVSHEIRTPLNAMTGFLEQTLNEPLQHELREKLTIVKSSSDHLVRIISDILDFSKLQSNKMNLEQVPFSINAVLQEMYVLFENSAEQSNNQLIYEKPKDEIPVVAGDSHRLRQILYNLLSNAVKFTSNGKIKLWAEVLSSSNQKLRISINVEDTGIGIPEEKLNKIFDDFSQSGPEITRKYGGTGLGLSIVKKLVELHHGSVQVKSTVNKGSLFTCNLEYELGDPDKMEQAVNHELIIPHEVKNLNVLLVDDEEYNRKLMQAILKKWNVNATEAVNGLDAIELIKSQRIDLVLMDSRMPVLDGVKATTFIRNNLDYSRANIPIIIVSAAVYEADMERYRSSGANEVLEKPFTEQNLLKTILSVLKSTSSVLNNSREDLIDSNSEPNFNELYRLIGNDKKFIREMLLKFIETTTNGLQSMKENLQAGNVLQIKELAHKLSSPCRHLNALKLLNFLKEIENITDEYSASQIQTLFEETENEFENIKQRITDHIKSLG
ncbi:MAG TPA: ATP-binding protein [Bacteroidales bacterium]